MVIHKALLTYMSKKILFQKINVFTSCILKSSFIISFSCWMSTDGTLIWTFTIPIIIVVTVSYHRAKTDLGFSVSCRKTKSNRNVNTTMNQWEHEANIGNWYQARENVCDQAAVGFCLHVIG